LAQIPSARKLRGTYQYDKSTGFIGQLARGLNKNTNHLPLFFESVRDFNGIQHRYGQISASDFIDFLILKAPEIFVGFNFTNSNTCMRCRWTSIKDSAEPSFKLYFPTPSPDSISLQELVERNSKQVLDGTDAVFCGNCACKTSMSVSRSFPGKVVIVELMRGYFYNGQRCKHFTKVTFPIHDITLTGSTEKFRVIASCHHSGTVAAGHWFSWITMDKRTWWKIDDLKSTHKRLSSAAIRAGGQTISILLLIADSMLR